MLYALKYDQEVFSFIQCFADAEAFPRMEIKLLECNMNNVYVYSAMNRGYFSSG